jgi:outer membrane protein OmpA-like peptidoglycan-associated protein
MRRLIAAAMLGVLCAAAAQAQQPMAGQVLNLVFPVENLTFTIESLNFKVENLGGQVQALQVRETATETRIELPADILFDFDKADIRAAAEPALRQAAEVIRKGARGTVRIEGHSDGKGSPPYNQKLSERRAASVQKWLTERAGLRAKFAAKGFGATKPVASNVKPDGSDHPEGRQMNRRVEIVFGKT